VGSGLDFCLGPMPPPRTRRRRRPLSACTRR